MCVCENIKKKIAYGYGKLFNTYNKNKKNRRKNKKIWGFFFLILIGKFIGKIGKLKIVHQTMGFVESKQKYVLYAFFYAALIAFRGVFFLLISIYAPRLLIMFFLSMFYVAIFCRKPKKNQKSNWILLCFKVNNICVFL